MLTSTLRGSFFVENENARNAVHVNIPLTELANLGAPGISETGSDLSGIYLGIFTIQYPVPLFSFCTKSLIAVLKDAKQLSEENGGGPFC